MTAKEVLATLEKADPSQEELFKVHAGVSDLIAKQFSPEELVEINEALGQSDAEFARGEGLTSDAIRKEFGLS